MYAHQYPLAMLAVASPTSALPVFDQKLLGPAYPAPSYVAADASIRATAADVSAALGRALEGGQTVFGNLTGKSTSLSMTALSALDDSPFVDFHYTARVNLSSESTTRVTAETMYRVGSISKLFTVYALLLHGGAKHWDRPVTDFIPELRDAASKADTELPFEHVQWHDVTVGALASQLSGIGQDYNTDLATESFPWTERGFPPLPQSDIPTCGANSSYRPCSRKEYLEGFIKRHPVLLPYTGPTYSNSAFTILGYVLEAIAASSYTSVLSQDVFQPLGLERTSTDRPCVSGIGVIPRGDSGWNWTLGDDNPNGGLYSSSRDLVTFGRALLTSQQLSPQETRRWMKPQAHTASLSFSVGAPWEIIRTRSQVSSGYVVDLYTKTGSLNQYHSVLVLVPDFQVAFAVLAAGPESGQALHIATETTLQAFLPVMDRLGQGQACHNFCGRYSDGSGSFLVLSTDDNGPGLLVEQWASNGSDMLRTLQAYSDTRKSGIITSVRLYPTMEAVSLGNSTGSRSAAFRAAFKTLPAGYNASIRRIFDPNAEQWIAVDSPEYGRIGLDDFVFHLDSQRNVVAVKPQAVRQTLYKVGSC
ncbi:beta-lactamase [Hirsutella rhossiliensis]|uniref:Beta-lactamase domain-containing protein n=1 Tax=Hirsutella rhossiliensis TaxID=111463 RepID=A0A9P8MS45_9HYPO|nr:beta-lactamase domain-containing protein [Hirsutella rhossiliensis]KAH0958212.1 beta-lactamase domain-containing protein [Hirsutella rhossiliensis]